MLGELVGDADPVWEPLGVAVLLGFTAESEGEDGRRMADSTVLTLGVVSSKVQPASDESKRAKVAGATHLAAAEFVDSKLIHRD